MTNEQWKDKGICYECRRKSYCNKSCKAHDDAIKRRLSELVTERVFGKKDGEEMSRTVHGTSCWECSDFNIKNTMGEECEGNKHIFCDKSLAEHDKQIRADAIDEFAKLIHKDLYQLNHHQVDFLVEQLKEQK